MEILGFHFEKKKLCEKYDLNCLIYIIIIELVHEVGKKLKKVNSIYFNNG